MIHYANLQVMNIMKNGRYQMYKEEEEEELSLENQQAIVDWRYTKKKTKRAMIEMLNRLKTELEDRSVRLQDLNDRFSILLNLNSVVIEDKQERETNKLWVSWTSRSLRELTYIKSYWLHNKCLFRQKTWMRQT